MSAEKEMVPRMETMYLKSNVQVEPLFGRWYAWSHLIPPATAARNITERHLKIMESYISAPQIHAAAVKNPKMLGGPFIDYGGERVEEIAELRDQTKRMQSHLIELSNAIADLDSLLRKEATGYSVQPLYARVPPILRGFVELVYDLNNHPSFRILETLLYRSMYYDRSAQSLALSLISTDERPFVLSTPRLDSNYTVHLKHSFDSDIVDWLFRAKRTPVPWEDIRNRLTQDDERTAVLRTMFTDTPPKPYQRYVGPGIRWRYFGHACILVETSEMSILFDPVLSYTYESGISRYTYDDLPDKIDYVVITHNHQDHILFETLLQIRHKVDTFIVPRNNTGSLQDPSVKLLLEFSGCKHVIEIDDLHEITFPNGSITAIPFLGEHADLDIRSKSGYVVRFGSHRLMFLADSCNVEPRLYEHVHRQLGDMDALFIGMECDGAPLSWLYGPLLCQKVHREMDQSRRLSGSDFDQAFAMVDQFKCKEVYVYAMGQEPWLNYIMSIKYTEASRPIVESDRLLAECKSRGILAERLFGEKEILID
jgi:L-ascorbate metabolism protein UlaG (beta-lactamase superfamily)